jgi:alpha-tubulin suppressor-like RCC1 family protein
MTQSAFEAYLRLLLLVVCFTCLSAPVGLAQGSDVTFHACVVLSDGTLRCWGRNNHGQLGDGTATNSTTPVQVIGITTATAVATGGSAITGDSAHSCARLSDGGVNCWGNNASGQLGNGTTTSSLTPVQVSGITTATAVAAGGAHSCGLLSDGKVRCWGNNNYGQLGNETQTSSSTPVQVKAIQNATAIATGAYHTCALLSNGEVWCWGRRDFGQLGDGKFRNDKAPFDAQLKPVKAIGINTATAITAGDVRTCARLSNGTLRCWGSNTYGGLGDGTITSSAAPVQVIGVSTATAISSGTHHTCAVLSDGTMRCWGNNEFG